MRIRIKEIRKKRGLTGPQMAKKLNISTPHYYDMENEKKRIHAEMLSKIADILGTSTDYLLGRTNDPSPPPPSRKGDKIEPSSSLTDLIEQAAELPEEQQELIAGHWKWALDVVRRQEEYKTKNEQSLHVEEKQSKYQEKEPDDIDVRNTPMAANLEDGTESILLTPELKDLIENSIRESRRKRREREEREKQNQKINEEATTDKE